MIAHFCLRLICGMSLMWCLMPRREVTSGFFRIQMLVVLGLSALSALTLNMFADGSGDHLLPLFNLQLNTITCWTLAAVAFMGSVMWTLERRRAGAILGGMVFALSMGLLLAAFPRPVSSTVPGEVLRYASDVSSASMLGGAMTAMLLGHWYLTAPTMSIDPLKKLTCYFGIASVFRLLISAVSLATAWGSLGDSTHWMWLALRWIAGIFGPLLLTVMVWRILKYRNTQSATGVLFVCVILTFIGEMTGSLLYQAISRPL